MLKFNVKNQIIERTDSFMPVADSCNYLKAEFSMTEEWQGSITAVFGYGGKFYRVLLDDDNSCMVPWEVIKPPLFTVSLFCGEESLVTANVQAVEVKLSGMKEGTEPTEPTPEIWQQYMMKMQQNIENAVPYIGENGNWYFYNAELGEYEDSEVLAAPERGIDYWTDADKAEIKEEVEPFIVNFSKADDGTITADQKFTAIQDAYKAQKVILGFLTYTKDAVPFIDQFYYIGTTGYAANGMQVLKKEKAYFVNPQHNGFSYLIYNSMTARWVLETNTLATETYVDEQIGDIETALDNIIAIQNQLMGVSE